MNSGFLSEGARRVLFIPPAVPLRLQIEVTNRCNMTCPMCQRYAWNLPQKDMDLECFCELLQWVPIVPNRTLFLLCGYGEPFLNCDLLKMVDLCRERKITTQTTTNGALLPHFDTEELLRRGPDKIGLSLESVDGKTNTGHSPGIDLDFIRAFSQKAFERSRPAISLQTTFHDRFEESMDGLLKFAQESKISRISVTRLDQRFNNELNRPDFSTEKKWADLFSAKARSLGIRVDSTFGRFQGWRRLFFLMGRNALNRFDTRCSKTFDYLYLRMDGTVTPCCALPFVEMGNWKNQSMQKIWKDGELTEFRKKISAMCKGCDVLKFKQICGRTSEDTVKT